MKYALVNGIILDGTKDMEPQYQKAILLNGDTIEDIIDIQNLKGGYKKIDLDQKYVLPGLINMHSHLALEGAPAKEKEKPIDYKALYDFLENKKLILKFIQKRCEGYAKDELMGGVTTCRAVGGILDFDAKIRDKINENKIVGPRILCANMAISVPKGHFAGSLATEANSVEDVIKDVLKIHQTHPDLIKLMITGGVMDCEVVGEPGMLKMPAEFVKAACDQAHQLGYPVAAHVESPIGVKVALENGVDTIEHGAKPDEDIIRLFKEKKASLICTLSPAIPYARMDPSLSHATKEAKINGKVVLDGIIACANECLKNDIPVGLGNDASCPFVTHYDFYRELIYFQKYCHVSNQFALYTATLQNAKIAGIDHITGSIEKGKKADLIVTNENPLKDLHTLKNLYMVIQEGKIYDDIKIKRNKKVEEALYTVV